MTAQDQIKHFGEVPLEITAELVRRQMKVCEILGLEEGEILVSARSAGENVDVYIGGVLFGHGEVVVIENKIGIRITDFRSGE
jgi:flagellar motor switch protein FliN/FliY